MFKGKEQQNRLGIGKVFRISTIQIQFLSKEAETWNGRLLNIQSSFSHFIVFLKFGFNFGIYAQVNPIWPCVQLNKTNKWTASKQFELSERGSERKKKEIIENKTEQIHRKWENATKPHK